MEAASYYCHVFLASEPFRSKGPLDIPAETLEQEDLQFGWVYLHLKKHDKSDAYTAECCTLVEY